MKIEPKILKGFRDFLPKEARKRQYVIDTLRKVFESYGFEPLETPALEYEEILAGKYGEEGERLMYRFEDKGGRRVALRYDQTVPLARVVAQYGSTGSPQVLPLPFKRYQISNVWRGENPQRGRFREFTQCDIDTVGTSSLLADAEIIEVAIESLKTLGFENFKVLLNDRSVLNDFRLGFEIESEKVPAIIRSIDKFKKIGEEEVKKEIEALGFTPIQSSKILQNIKQSEIPKNIKEITNLLSKFGIENKTVQFYPILARGLNYYTGMIFEIEIDGYEAGSVCGGGRFDNLIGLFSGQTIPAVGCAFGFDRVIEAMETLSLFPENLQTTKALVTIFSSDLIDQSIKACEVLSDANIPQELYVDENAKMDKQLKYADQKGIPYAIIIGPKEAETNSVTLKNMKTGEQKTLELEDLPKNVV